MREQGPTNNEIKPNNPTSDHDEHALALEAHMIGKLLEGKDAPTEDDFREAYKTLEELRVAAAQESTFKKISYNILRKTTKMARNIVWAAIGFGSNATTPPGDFEADPAIFIDAAKKLRDLENTALHRQKT